MTPTFLQSYRVYGENRGKCESLIVLLSDPFLCIFPLVQTEIALTFSDITSKFHTVCNFRYKMKSHTEFGGMFITCPYTKFYMSKSSLVIGDKL
jgi:hypothetical protein